LGLKLKWSQYYKQKRNEETLGIKKTRHQLKISILKTVSTKTQQRFPNNTTNIINSKNQNYSHLCNYFKLENIVIEIKI